MEDGFLHVALEEEEEEEPLYLDVIQEIVRTTLPLHDAVHRGAPLHVVRRLAEEVEGALQQRDFRGRLPLRVAASASSPVPPEVVRYLVDKCPRALRERDDRGWLPLDDAIENGAPVEVVRILIDGYPRALRGVAHGRHPLCGAVKRSSAASREVVQLLIDRGPHLLLTRDRAGELPLQAAVYGGRPAEVVQLLVDACPQALRERDGSGYTPVHVAARFDSLVDVDVVRCLVDACPGALLQRCNNGELPLHIAVRYWTRLELVQCLVEGCPQALLVGA